MKKTIGILAAALLTISHLAAAEDMASSKPNRKPPPPVHTGFAIDIYKQLTKEHSNIFFSPYSIYEALSMTTEGARGKTASEMGNVMHYPNISHRENNETQPWNMSMIHERLAAFRNSLSSPNKAATAMIEKRIKRLKQSHAAAQAKTKELQKKGDWKASQKAAETEKKLADELNATAAKVNQFDLRIANGLWGEKTYKFHDSYKKTIDTYYGTGSMKLADFKNNFPDERARINGWVEKQTENRIKDLIPNLSPAEAKLLRLVLVNAIYFKGEWANPFKKSNTKPREFILADGAKKKIPMMHGNEMKDCRYGVFGVDGKEIDVPIRVKRDQSPNFPKDGFSMLQIPYKGSKLSMVLVAPNSPNGLANVEKQLTFENLDKWIDKLKGRDVHVTMPAFKMETDYKLHETLKKMGMVRAFTDPRNPNGADFSGISPAIDPMQKLYITKVLHKAFLEVNEKGTEAAAATAVMMCKATCAPMDVEYTPHFKADKPFLFLIRDNTTGTVLFMGRMVMPE